MKKWDSVKPCPRCGGSYMISEEVLLTPECIIKHRLKCDLCGYETGLYRTYAEAYTEWSEANAKL